MNHSASPDNCHKEPLHHHHHVDHVLSSDTVPLPGAIMANYNQATVAIIVYHIIYADGRVFHIDLSHKAKGQECLDKVCKILGISDESEYFGLRFYGTKNEFLWVNLRNRLQRQLPTHQPPYNLYFRVKYYVPPHMLQLEETRHQFYLNVVEQLKDGAWCQELSPDLHGQMIALMAQTEFGDFQLATMPCKYACFWPDTGEEIPAEVIRTAAEVHRTLEGRDRCHVEYELLATVETNLRLYGAFFFEVKNCFEKKMMIAIGPEGVYLCARDKKVESSYPFSRIHQVTDRDKVVFLSLYNDDGTTHTVGYRLISRMAATSLYRCITEMRCFYRCDSVAHDILEQSMYKPSIFSGITHHHGSHNTEREYMFDIRHTCREVSDHARRRLHGFTHSASPPGTPPTAHRYSSLSGSRGDSISGHTGAGHHMSRTKSSVTGSIASDDEVSEIRQQLERFRDSTLCRICMDRTTNRVFYPCGHPVCCAECSEKVDSCPICRKPIQAKNPFYAPWAMDSFFNLLIEPVLSEENGEAGVGNRQASLQESDNLPPMLNFSSKEEKNETHSAHKARRVVFSESSSSVTEHRSGGEVMISEVGVAVSSHSAPPASPPSPDSSPLSAATNKVKTGSSFSDSETCMANRTPNTVHQQSSSVE